ncbi:MAG: AAA family ATPase [Magnetococcus sp. WYHC-3]
MNSSVSLNRAVRAAALLDEVILGKPHAVRLALCCLLAGGHLLIEDRPGVGKTTLAHALSTALGLAYARIQFTSDLLPSDITGVSVYDRERELFRFHPGPIFAGVVLADEINRATPKAQSALLEAMEERQVTVEGETRPLPDPFFVIATQNPARQVGTFPLPESQLDRFLMRISLGYPDRAAERQLLLGRSRRDLVAQLPPVADPGILGDMIREVQEVHTAPALLDYIQSLAEFTRLGGLYTDGLSPRAVLGLLRAARAWAWLAGRRAVLPEDVQTVLPGVAAHRLGMATGDEQDRGIRALIEAVSLP